MSGETTPFAPRTALVLAYLFTVVGPMADGREKLQPECPLGVKSRFTAYRPGAGNGLKLQVICSSELPSRDLQLVRECPITLNYRSSDRALGRKTSCSSPIKFCATHPPATAAGLAVSQLAGSNASVPRSRRSTCKPAKSPYRGMRRTDLCSSLLRSCPVGLS